MLCSLCPSALYILICLRADHVCDGIAWHRDPVELAAQYLVACHQHPLNPLQLAMLPTDWYFCSVKLACLVYTPRPSYAVKLFVAEAYLFCQATPN